MVSQEWAQTCQINKFLSCLGDEDLHAEYHESI